MPKCRIYCNVLQKCNIRTNFCECFAILLNENPTHAVFFHAACWLLYGPKQAHTFSTLQQSRFWAQRPMKSLHARVRKPSQKSVKKGVQASLGCLQRHSRTTFSTFYKNCENLFWAQRPMKSLHAWFRWSSRRSFIWSSRWSSWALKIDAFQKDFARKEVSIGRVAGTVASCIQIPKV